jgi:hypothetical protein
VIEMFEKTSRYYKLPDEVITDSSGGKNKAKSLRPLPEVTGKFLHTVQEGDRLDRMAYKYYKKSKKWWRICDANPDFFLPQALLGNDVLSVYRIPVESSAPEPRWPDLLRSLAGAVGIEHVTAGTAAQPHPGTSAVEGALLFSIDPGLEADFSTAVRTQALTVPLTEAFEDEGIVFLAGARVDQPGPGQWRIDDYMQKRAYFLRLEGGALNVYEAILSHRWSVTVVFNSTNLSVQDVASRIEVLGFETGAAGEIGRIGKTVIIPADTAG